MTVPVIDALARQYPALHITVLSKPHVAPLFEALPDNVKFFGADVKQQYKGLRGLRRLARALRGRDIDAVADFHNVLRSKILNFFFVNHGLNVATIDKGRDEKKKLTKGTLRRQLPTSFERYLRVLRRLGLDVKLDFDRIAYPDANRITPLVGEKAEGDCWIGVAPFAAHPGKIYPIIRMHDAIALFLEKHPGARIFVFGSPGEMKAIHEAWAEDFPRLVFVPDVIHGMGDELRLMQHLDAMISMDSANMHLASNVGCPVVSIWGQTHPYAGFMGYNQDPQNAVQLDLPCRPCSIYGNKICRYRDFRCLTHITPQQVVDALEKVLTAPKP